MKLYRGVVEDNLDPQKLGRVRVRILGLHTADNENSGEDFTYIKTSDLPWSEVMGGTEFGLISGVGVSSVLRQGTWVWVTLDHENPNKPIVIGTIIGKNTTKKNYADGEGFCDPDGVYPQTGRDTRSDMHPNLDTKYPTIAVLETESGHVIELDDTPNDRRIKVTHTSGSYILIDDTGNITVNGVANITYNIAGNANWNIGGNATYNVTGSNTVTADSSNMTLVGGYVLTSSRVDMNEA